MYRIKKCFIWLLLFIGNQVITNAQVSIVPVSPLDFNLASSIISTNIVGDSVRGSVSDSVVKIRDIIIEGNTITRDIIILRELPFKKGDSIHLRDTTTLFNKAVSQLRNTSLFTASETAVGIVQAEGKEIDIKIEVKERWYLFVLPHLKPSDRNLSQWLFKESANAARVDYGIKIMYDNVSGNRDKLRFYFITGYTKQLRLSYSRPFIDKDLKWGMNVDVSVGKNHEINYGTRKNKQLFLKEPNDYTRNFFDGNIEFTYRPALFTTHTFGFGYNSQKIADTVLKLNPNYFFNNAKQVNYPELYYRLSYTNLDYIPYPTKGYAAELYIEKRGINSKMNLWSLSAKGMGSWHLSPKMYYSISALGSVKIPFKQPYYNSQMMGYGDLFLRGYEYYVMDGVAGGVINATLGRQLTNFSINLPILKKYTSRLIPLKIFGKVYGNTGYVHNPQPGFNPLTNRMLYGGGFGFDIITDYDFTLKIDFSFNHLGENGLYLQKKTLF